MQPTELQLARFEQAFWMAADYQPTTGEFPIYDMDGKLVTTSRGQQEIHDCTARVIQVTGGIRGGKSKFLSMKTARHTLREQALIWCCAPDYDQARHVFRYLIEPLVRMGVIEGEPSQPRHGGQYAKTTWGCEIMTKSGKDLQTLAGSPPDVFLVDEANQLPPEILDRAAERTLEKNGYIYLGGTIEKAYPWFAEKWEAWQGPNPENARSFSLPSWSNTSIFPGGREDPKIKELEAILGPEVFLERCAAIPCKPSGLVFKEFSNKTHVKPIEYNDNLPVELAIDPGTLAYAIEAIQWETLTVKQWLERSESEALLLRRTKDELAEPLTKVYVIDEIYRHDVIVQDVLPEVQAKPWIKNVRSGVIDIASKQRHANKSQQQIWMEETRIPLRMAKIGINTGIGVYRLRLRDNPLIMEPLIQFDYRLRTGKNHLGQALGILGEHDLYKWPNWVEGGNEKIKPIDANNHGVKAVAYWEYDMFGPVEERDTLPKGKIRGYF